MPKRAIVSYGGLGNLLASGVQQDFKAQILAASVSNLRNPPAPYWFVLMRSV